MDRDAWGELPEHAPPRPWTPVDLSSAAEPSPTTWYSASGADGASSRPDARGGPARTVGPVVAAIAAVVALLVAVGLAVPRLLPTGSAARAVAGSATPDQGSASTSGSTQAAEDRDAEIAALLVHRGQAVTRDDAALWRRTQTPTATAPAFSRLAVLPVTEWVYDVRSTQAVPGGTTVQLDVRVRLRYDVDTSDSLVRERLTLHRAAAGWLVAAETTAGRRAQPWDLGTLSIARGSRTLVIGIDTPASTLRSYARLADASVPDVDAVWGRDWERSAVLVVPRTVAQLGRALDRTPASLEGYAAVTTGETTSDADGRSALRVWTNTPSMADLSSLGRGVVVRHEVTHVATAAPSTPGVPLWLEEGFAEYVGYRGSGIALRVELGELVRAQRKGRVPAHLPTEAMFEGDEVDIAYEAGDLACRVVADTYGQKALVRLYRLTVAGSRSENENLDAALRAVTGSGTEALEAAWHARLRALAA